MHEDGSDEENEAMMRRTPALLGMKFEDAEDREIVRKVALALGGTVLLSVVWFIAHVAHKGQFIVSFGHLLSSLLLPVIGFYGVKRQSCRLLWLFHLGNVQFAILHAVVGFILLRFTLQLYATDSKAVCSGEEALRLPPAPPGPHSHHAPLVVPTQPPLTDSYRQCVLALEEEQGDAPVRLIWWMFVTAPLWFLMIYSAYQSHEYYFRLRIRRLTARTDAEGNAVVQEREEEGMSLHPAIDPWLSRRAADAVE